MLTTDATIMTPRLQRAARRLLLGACCILLMGVMGAAADRTAERTHKPATPTIAPSPAAKPMLAASTAAAQNPAPADLEDLIDQATPRHLRQTLGLRI